MDESECLACVAANIRKRARRRRLTLERLADLSGISRASMWSLLAGDHYPTLRSLVRIANALGCEPRDLLEPVPPRGG